MQVWIALFRGINVGGHNVLPMAELRSSLEAIKLKNVRTYIQSGNVVFESSAKKAETLASRIRKQVEVENGFSPEVFVLGSDELLATIESNPFPDAAATDPKSLHFFFLHHPIVKIDQGAIDRARSKSEDFRLVGRVFYLHAPDGIGRSKLAANAERYLGVTATARNLRTVTKICSMMNS
ncbi:MAG: DUF1697 domain-containing protein [Planctomycetota bacterium]